MLRLIPYVQRKSPTSDNRVGLIICYSDVVPVRGLERLINLLEKNAISEIGEAEFEALVVFLSCLLATKNA